MARIEWVKHRLNNWALWWVDQNTGGMGFASQSSFLNDAPGQSGRESRIPIDEVEASVTNDAVETLKVPRPQLYRTLHCIYPRGMGIKGTAQACDCGESTIKAHLDIADNVLATWFREESERKHAQRQAFAAAHTGKI